MNKYTIYCTESQTKKALELGAPIEKLSLRIFTNEERYKNPTTEQMIGWLEELNIIDEINISKNWDDTDTYVWSFDFYDKNYNAIGCGGSYVSRKEATLAAIDAALEYLTNNKK